MVKPFTSDRFTRDPFFAKDTVDASGLVTIKRAVDGVTVTLPLASFQSGLDPTRAGALASRPGRWATISVLVKDFESGDQNNGGFGIGSEPAAHDEWTVDGVTHDVDQFNRLGDVFEVKAVAKQRAHR